MEELKHIDRNYNEAIDTILRIQSSIEQNRDNLPLLNQALPSTPEVNKIITDIQTTASSSGIVISKLGISEVSIKKTGIDKNIKKYNVSFQSNSTFESIQQFISSFLSQRRLKLIDSVNITRDQKESSTSAQLGVTFEIQSFYL